MSTYRAVHPTVHPVRSIMFTVTSKLSGFRQTNEKSYKQDKLN